MTYQCFYYITVKRGEEQDLIDFLRKNRGEMTYIARYTSDPESSKHPIIPPEGVIVIAELSSKEDAHTLKAYLKSLEHVKQVVMGGPYNYPTPRLTEKKYSNNPHRIR